MASSGVSKGRPVRWVVVPSLTLPLPAPKPEGLLLPAETVTYSTVALLWIGVEN